MEPQNMEDQIEQPEVIENEQPEQIEQEATEVEEKTEEPQETEAEKRARKERNRAIREKYRAEAETKHLRERLEKLEGEATQRRTEQPAELNPNQFNTHHEYEQALLDQRIEAKVSERMERERQSSKQREEQMKAQEGLARVASLEEELRTEFTDFNDVIAGANRELSHIGLNPALQYMVANDKDGVRAFYHLAKDVDALHELNRMPPYEAAAAFKEFARKQQPPQSKVSKAPAPIKPVTTASTSPSGEPNPSTHPKEWQAWWANRRYKQRS